MTALSQTLSEKEIIKALSDCVAPAKVLTDADSLKHYGCDWTKMYAPDPLAIVLPRTVEQVQAVVRFANTHQIALVPSGGRTGLSGAAVAANREVVVAFDAMNRILDYDGVDRLARCEPGVITEQLQTFAAERGLFYPVDFASSGSSQLGGNISTNAGGIKVIRYGMTRDWVAGLKVVTGTGELLDLNKGLIKNATGYDMRQLFIGAEGTLGFIVEATMRLTRPPRNLSVMVLGVPALSSLMSVLDRFQSVLDLTAFEFFSDNAVSRVTARGDVPRPFEAEVPFYALVEFEAASDEALEQAMSVFEACVEQGWVIDGVLSQSEAQAKALWRLREDISETLAPFTPYKNDISVKVSQVPDFLEAVDQVVTAQYPDFETVWFGHIGDGNLHLNILKPEELGKDDFFAQCHDVSRLVFEVVARHEGSISAEHGVGLLKRDYLSYSRSDEEVACMRALKAVFDPKGIMNPGKVFS